MSNHVKLKYRPDVDGLRAIAVIAVIFFHGGLGMPGGFIGVDVFFVISGFLITKLIIKDLKKGTFSLANFWERRIRRIWPAAMVVTLGALVGGYLIMMPPAYKWLATDGIAQLAMLANVQFWRTTDYFGPAAETRTLLHTWSLAVEEQFYLIFPFILMFTWRYGRKVTLGTIATIMLGSFILSIWGVSTYPMAAFYLLPFRMWELKGRKGDKDI